MNRLWFFMSAIAAAGCYVEESYVLFAINIIMGAVFCFFMAVDQGVARELRKRK